MRKKLIGIIILILVIFCFFLIIKDTSNISNVENSIFNEEWIPISEIDISKVTDNIIGYLSIPCLNNEFYINMEIKEGTDLQVLATSIGHFIDTPYLNGNVCLAAHNSGTKNGKYVGYFDTIKNLENGDLIYYDTLENTYIYKVVQNKIIPETDLSVLDNTNKNILTLITCTQNRAYRQCIIAERIKK